MQAILLLFFIHKQKKELFQIFRKEKTTKSDFLTRNGHSDLLILHFLECSSHRVDDKSTHYHIMWKQRMMRDGRHCI